MNYNNIKRTPQRSYRDIINTLGLHSGLARLKCEDVEVLVRVTTMETTPDGISMELDVLNHVTDPTDFGRTSLKISKVIFNDPATIVLWADGTKTVVKCQEGDIFDEEKGLAMAICKKAYGNKGNFNDIFKEWVPEEVELNLKDLDNEFTNFGDYIRRILNMPIKQVEEYDRAVSQLEKVSGQSIDDLTKLFAEGNVLCEKDFVDRLISRVREIETRAAAAYRVLNSTYQVENGNLPSAMEEAIGFLGDVLGG